MANPAKDDENQEIEHRIPTVFRTVVDSSTEPETQRTLAKYQLIYSLTSLLLGITCIVGGVVLFLNGVTGATNWTASILGAESAVSDAAPRAVLFIIGLFVVFVTRYRFEHK